MAPKLELLSTRQIRGMRFQPKLCCSSCCCLLHCLFSLHADTSIKSQNSAATAKCSTRFLYYLLNELMTKLLNNFLRMLVVEPTPSQERTFSSPFALRLFVLLVSEAANLAESAHSTRAASKSYAYVILHYQQSGSERRQTQMAPHIAFPCDKIILLHSRFSQ